MRSLLEPMCLALAREKSRFAIPKWVSSCEIQVILINPLRNPYLCLSGPPPLLEGVIDGLMTNRIQLVVQYALLPTLLVLGSPHAPAQTQSAGQDVDQLRQLVFDLERRVAVLEQQNQQLRSSASPPDRSGPDSAASLVLAAAELRPPGSPSPLPAQAVTTSSNPAPPLPGTLPGGATPNYTFDGYYEFNFNQPTGRVNDLRAYDVLSNVFSINQADFIFDLDPDVSANRRYGFRIDLQFGQATETLQGNPANETRPEIYRNIFQAYGSYIFPAGHGIDVDFGKWASSLGIENNYTKDQPNYSRSYYFYFLPFYHAGVRTSYKFNDKFTANYWIDNGTNQSEPTNGFKDELFGFGLQPAKSVSWTTNYYLGQEHPDTVAAANCTVPVQPGLCLAPITPAPNGKLHIFDSYASWTVTPKLTLAAEGDYVIQREWVNAAPGESSAPSHVDGGAAYAQYQLIPRGAIAARTEYLSDRGGLFSNQTQALKEVTGTWKYNLTDNFDAFLEYRRDWSNRPYFVTNNPAAPSTHQDTALLGLVWWYGGKQGSW
jgi:Putative beta-barrel porin-2, OmpL-like. bbp2